MSDIKLFKIKDIVEELPPTWVHWKENCEY